MNNTRPHTANGRFWRAFARTCVLVYWKQSKGSFPRLLTLSWNASNNTVECTYHCSIQLNRIIIVYTLGAKKDSAVLSLSLSLSTYLSPSLRESLGIVLSVLK